MDEQHTFLNRLREVDTSTREVDNSA